jgi:methylated-DNA-protein-cysteine methyltransferase-like protein
MNASHALKDVPAHRVVNRIGLLTGKNHFSDPNEMQEKLEKEGVKVLEDRVVEFDKLLWDPGTELM